MSEDLLNTSGSSESSNPPLSPYPGWMWQDLSKGIVPQNTIFDKHYGFYPVDEEKGQGWVYEAKDAVPDPFQVETKSNFENMQQIQKKNDLVIDQLVKEKYPDDFVEQEKLRMKMTTPPDHIPQTGLQCFNPDIDPSDNRLDLRYFFNPLTLTDPITGLKFQPKTQEGDLMDAYPYANLQEDVEFNKNRQIGPITNTVMFGSKYIPPYQYDYKRHSVPEMSYVIKDQDGKGDKVGQYEPYGNFTYGALGTASGFSPDYLHSVAGLIQHNPKPEWGNRSIPNPWGQHFLGSGNLGDDFRDTYHMNQGIDWINKGQ